MVANNHNNNFDEQAKQRAEDRAAARAAALRPQRVVSIAAGEHLSMCVTDRGEVFATGDNSHGQLGSFAAVLLFVLMCAR